MSATRKFGIRGWQRLEGFYPPRVKPAEMLRHYAAAADVVETPNTFSGIPKPARLAEWAEQAPDGFLFDVIAFGGLTLHQRRPGDTGPIGRRSWQDISVVPPDVLFDDFAQALAPLAEAGKLGCVLLQFPHWFGAGDDAREYLAHVSRCLPNLPLAAEFRHPSWDVPSQFDATLEQLIDLEMTLVVADYPLDRPEAGPPTVAVTTDRLSVVRLHGRNGDAWPRTEAMPVEPMQHTYSDEELAPWVARVRELSDEASEVHVLVGTTPHAAALDAGNRLMEAIAEAEEAEARWGYVP